MPAFFPKGQYKLHSLDVGVFFSYLGLDDCQWRRVPQRAPSQPLRGESQDSEPRDAIYEGPNQDGSAQDIPQQCLLQVMTAGLTMNGRANGASSLFKEQPFCQRLEAAIYLNIVLEVLPYCMVNNLIMNTRFVRPGRPFSGIWYF